MPSVFTNDGAAKVARATRIVLRGGRDLKRRRGRTRSLFRYLMSAGSPTSDGSLTAADGSADVHGGHAVILRGDNYSGRVPVRVHIANAAGDDDHVVTLWIDEADIPGAAGEYKFQTIDVNDADSGFTWGTADVVADTSTDTLKLVAGSGIELKSDHSLDAVRITATGGSSTDAFKTLDVNDADSGFTWGTADVVADTSTDTLKLVAGNGIELKSDATNDAIRLTRDKLFWSGYAGTNTTIGDTETVIKIDTANVTQNASAVSFSSNAVTINKTCNVKISYRVRAEAKATSVHDAVRIYLTKNGTQINDSGSRFSKAGELGSVSFEYEDDEAILPPLAVSITSGDIIRLAGINGSTGAGSSNHTIARGTTHGDWTGSQRTIITIEEI